MSSAAIPLDDSPVRRDKFKLGLLLAVLAVLALFVFGVWWYGFREEPLEFDATDDIDDTISEPWYSEPPYEGELTDEDDADSVDDAILGEDWSSESLAGGPPPATPTIDAPPPEIVYNLYSTPVDVTEASTYGSGSKYGETSELVFQRVSCGDMGLQQFQYERKPTNKQMRYRFRCLGFNGEGVGESKTTEWQTSGSGRQSGWLIYLDRHKLDCGKRAINEFKLAVRGPNGNKEMQYQYKCNVAEAQGACRTVKGAWETTRIETKWLDRLPVKCNVDEVITSFQFKRHSTRSTKSAYHYNCCKMN